MMIDTGMAQPLRLRQRRPSVGEPPIEGHSDPGASADAINADRTRPDADTLAQVAPGVANFEHRRIVNVVRHRLFGSGQLPRIGRYTIERRLGSGGMGEVYLAHDQALDRKIAIKRVHLRSASERAQRRLRREARGLARLSHPNVVQVYEVDEHEGQTFLAMEYVDGQTLREWLDEQPRPWRAVLEVFLAAGRGLAAAHEAGLVHRDFKPDNVLLGRDGSVRVADFGLVLADDGRRTEPSDVLSTLPNTDPDTRATTPGAVVGTIRYMSLEQLCGRPVDARSDQFSFCVALYEALWGKPPFSLKSSAARLRALTKAEPAAPGRSPHPRPPAALWRIVRRGLSKAPHERWPQMPALLDALQAVTQRRRRLVWAASAATTLTMAAGLGAWVTSEEPNDPCAAVDRELTGAWDIERRADLEAALAGLEARHAADSRQRVFAGLDRWAMGWVQVREQTCRARANRRVDPELAGRQSACLARQRQQAGDLVDLLTGSQTDVDSLAGAVDAVAELPHASTCDDQMALLGLDLPPPGIADQVATLRRELDRARGMRLLGRVEQGLILAEQTERAAQPLDYGPLHAEALAELAKAELTGGSTSRAIERLQQAIDTAEIHHHDYLAAELWIELAMRILKDHVDEQTGAWALHRAEVLNQRVDASPRARGRLLFARGQLAELREDLEQAEQAYRAALEQIDGDQAAAPDVPTYWSTLARLVANREPSDPRALELYQTALNKAEALFGPHHPQTAQRAYRLGLALQGVEPERATELLVRASESWMASHTRPHQELAKAQMVLARSALNAGDLSAAERHAREVARVQAQSLPRGHTAHGDPPYLLATILAVRGEHREALDQARLALSLWEPVYGPQTRRVQHLRSNVAAMLLALGRLDEASAELDTLLPYVQGNSEEVSVRLRRCEVALRREQLDAANTELRTIEAHHADLGPYAFSHALLRALVDVRRGKLRPPAIERLRRTRAHAPVTQQQLDDWYTELGMSTEERALLLVD
ncbi:MAG: protein kinase [Myxococcota bacterium]